MKKYLMTGVAALALCAGFTACSSDEDLYDPDQVAQNEVAKALAQYQEAFVNAYGKIDTNHTWGFGQFANATRSAAAPAVADIDAPFDEAWVAEYLKTAKEADYNNTRDNYDNTTYATNYGEGGPNSIDWNDEAQKAERDYFLSLSWDDAVAWALANHPTWLTYSQDETYVTNFKITGTYSDFIKVAASEGLTDGERSNAERTIVVTGTWNITTDQAIGSLGKIIIADGGVVNVQSGVKLDLTNQARLVVLKGGKLTGEGLVQVNNGNAEGEENYNGGVIDVAQFNNNFGKFYNYGKFLVNEYNGGAQESNFYNHSLAAIDHFTSTANARIFNGCQFYVKNDARIRNYEGTQGSALIVGGQLLFSGSEDGTTTPTYVGLEAGALVQAGSLYNNGTSWVGPTENGYAVLNIGQFDFLNWEQDAPQNGGYFANNIYLVADVLDNVPDGNGMQQKTNDGTEYYTMSKADWKFENIVANATGNGNVKIALKGDVEIIPADPDFKLGEAGCTPGFKIKDGDEPALRKVRVICEDMSGTQNDDFDFNDAVFDLTLDENDYVTEIEILNAGAEYGISVDGKEIHDLLGLGKNPNRPEYYVMGGGSAKFAPSASNLKPQDVKVVAHVVIETKNSEGKIVYNRSDLALESVTGKAPGKILVKPTFKWCAERQAIDAKYPKFGEYVNSESVQWYE